MMKRKHQHGFSMIEVLIAVLILAIGLLGMAALQMASLGQGQESYFRSQATALSDDLASRIRSGRRAITQAAPVWGAPTWQADPVGAATAYATLFVGAPYACAAPPAPPPTNCRVDEANGAAVACSIAQQIAFDRWEVCTQANTLLPQGQVHVAVNGLRNTIAVSWLATEAREDTGEEEIRNPLCNEVFNLPTTRDCVVVESLP